MNAPGSTQPGSLTASLEEALRRVEAECVEALRLACEGNVQRLRAITAEAEIEQLRAALTRILAIKEPLGAVTEASSVIHAIARAALDDGATEA